MKDINGSGIDSDYDGDGRNLGDDDDGDGRVDDGDDSDDDGYDSNGGDGGGGGATLPSTPCRQSNGTGLHTQFRRVQKLTKTIIDFFRWKKYYNSIMLLFPGLPDGDNWRKRCKIVPSSFQIHANSAISRQKRETSIHWWWHYY